ncbi:MAG: carboxypeptidase-like regulatory domain-containing protein, partial [Bryobacteraceae bacterium]
MRKESKSTAFLKLGVLLALFACSVVNPLFAQLTSGNITGTVYDPTGATVSEAAVIAHNTETGVDVSTTSRSAGEFRFENLPVGAYTVTVSASGFTKAEVANVNVQLNQTVTTNVKLAIGKASTTVQVSEAAAPIDTTTAQLQTTYDSKQIADLPSASGGQLSSGVINLSLLNAGVTSSGGAGYGTGPSVGGQRPTNNSFTIEGIDNNNLNVTGPIVTVPNDAVSEFSVLQNQFSPDFGHSSGGQFNQVVKSGTNQFHG